MNTHTKTPSEFLNFGRYLLGPHPFTGEPDCWFYYRGDPPRPFTPEDNERAEKLAAEILNRDLVLAAP